jgi:2-methylcitrate dehydratase PrpD
VAPLALELGAWSTSFEPQALDERLARSALTDTVCVALAAHGHPIARLAKPLGVAGRWAAMAHALDYDDLHLPSTSHISAVCVPTALAYGGSSRAYLAGAGTMARVGILLGWRHYDAGWHATATAGVFGAAVTAAVSLQLSREEIAAAIALAVSAAGGVQQAFGSDAKPLQVGMAAHAGALAAEMAARGARPDLTAFDAWLPIVQATDSVLEDHGGSIPGGLAVKIFPCCYALQRPIFTLKQITAERELRADEIASIEMRGARSTVKPLIHRRPATGAQGKFSLEYGLAAAVLDAFPGQWSFSDAGVSRPAAQQLIERVRFVADGAGEGLLDGVCEVVVATSGGEVLASSLELPEGAPDHPPSSEALAAKAAGCLEGIDVDLDRIDWASAASILAAHTP